MMRSWAWLSLCGIVIVITAAAEGVMTVEAAAEHQSPIFEVTVKSGRLSVRADGARLADVLQAVGRQAQLKVIVQGGLDGLVTDAFTNLPVDEGVRRLSRWHSIVLVYEDPPEQATGPILAEVWVTSASSNRGSTNSDGVKRAAGEVQRDEAPASAVRPQQEQDLRPPGLTMALKFGASDSRRQIVEALVRERGGYAVVQILREAATRDPDPRVRRGAIQVLASLNSPDAVDAVQATLHDAHPGVRYEAQMALRRQSRARSSDASVD